MIKKNGTGYKIDVRVAKKRHRESGFHTRKQAQDFIDELRLNAKKQKAGLVVTGKGPTVAQLFEARKAEITSKADLIRATRVFQYFLDNVVPEGTKVTEVRTSHFMLFSSLRKKKVKAETVGRDLNPISKAFSVAAELFPKELEGYERPAMFRPKFKRKRRELVISEKGRDGILKHLYKSNETLAKMFELSWYLGLAYAEAKNLKKTDYDGTGVTFIRGKTGATVTFEWLPPRVHEILQSCNSDSELFFPDAISTTRTNEIMKEAVESAGLVYGRDKGITFHSARHSFVTNAMEHADLKTVGSMTGHTDDTMVLLYTHASAESRKRALQAMHGTKDLKEIFESVRSGKMDFEGFRRAVS